MNRPSGIKPAPYTEAQSKAWLIWLARNMQKHGKTVFMLEELQPSWLMTRRQQFVYFLCSSVLVGLIFGLIFGLALDLPIQAIRRITQLIKFRNFGVLSPYSRYDFEFVHFLHMDIFAKILVVRGIVCGLVFGMSIAIFGFLRSILKKRDSMNQDTNSSKWRNIKGVLITSSFLALPLGLILVSIYYRYVEKSQEYQRYYDNRWRFGAKLSPDGHWMVTMDIDKANQRTIHLWDLTTEDLSPISKALTKIKGRIERTKFSPNGQWLVTAFGYEVGNPTVRIWDLTAKDPSNSSMAISGFEGRFEEMTFSPDGRRLVILNVDGAGQRTAKLWDLSAAEPAVTSMVLAGVKGEHKEIVEMLFSPDGRWLVIRDLETDSGHRTASIWDLNAAKPEHSTKVFLGVGGIKFDPVTGRLATRFVESLGDRTKLWDLSAAEPAAASMDFRGVNGGIEDIFFSKDGRWLLLEATDGSIHLWDRSLPERSNASKIMKGLAGRIIDFDFSSHGQRMVVCYVKDNRYEVKCWDLTSADPSPLPVIYTVDSRYFDDEADIEISHYGHWIFMEVFNDSRSYLKYFFDLTSDLVAKEIEVPGLKADRAFRAKYFPGGEGRLTNFMTSLERFSLAYSDDYRSDVFRGGPEDEGLFDGSQRTGRRCR